MKGVVVYPSSGWILSHIADRMISAMPDVFHRVGQNGPVEDADFVFYCDIQNTFSPSIKSSLRKAVHVGLFTHLDKDSPESFRPHWDKLDGVVHMCRRYYDVFEGQRWYPKERMIVSRPGDPTHTFRLRRFMLGVVQRGGYVGKGSEFLPAVMSQLSPEIKRGMQLVVVGGGWKNSELSSIPGLNVLEISDTSADYPGFYQKTYDKLDALLVPSLWEGGPMSVIEAMAVGVPIIAARVGWVNDLRLEIPSPSVGTCFSTFDPGDVQGCAEEISWRVAYRQSLRSVVSGITYQTFASDVVSLIERLRGLK